MIEISTIEWRAEESCGLACHACEENIYGLWTWRMWMISQHSKEMMAVVVCESCYFFMKEME